jgi:hypothetical protein
MYLLLENSPQKGELFYEVPDEHTKKYIMHKNGSMRIDEMRKYN